MASIGGAAAKKYSPVARAAARPRQQFGAAPRAPQAQGVTGNNASWLDRGGSPMNVLYEPGFRPSAQAPGAMPSADMGGYNQQYKASLEKANSMMMANLDNAIRSLGQRRDAALGVINTLPQTSAANYEHSLGQYDKAVGQAEKSLSSDVKVNPAIAQMGRAAIASERDMSASSQPFLQLAANARYDEGVNTIEAQRADAAMKHATAMAQADSEGEKMALQRQWQLEDRAYEQEQAARQFAIERATGMSDRNAENREWTRRAQWELDNAAGPEGEPSEEYPGLTTQAIDAAASGLTENDLAYVRSGEEDKWDRIIAKYRNNEAALAALDRATGGANSPFGYYLTRWQNGGILDPESLEQVAEGVNIDFSKYDAQGRPLSKSSGGGGGESRNPRQQTRAVYQTKSETALRALAARGDRAAAEELARRRAAGQSSAMLPQR